MAIAAAATHFLARLYVAIDENVIKPDMPAQEDGLLARRSQGQIPPTTSKLHRKGQFPFLKLPPDIMNQVYDLVFAPLDAKTGIQIPLMQRKRPSRERLKRQLRTNNQKRRSELSLLCVSKQINRETSAYIWRNAYATLHEMEGAWKEEFIHLYSVIHGGRIGWKIKELDFRIGDRLRDVRRLELTGIDTLYFLLRTAADKVGQHFKRRKLGFMHRELEATKRRLIIARQALPRLERIVVYDEAFDEFNRFNIQVPGWLTIFLFPPHNSLVRLRIAFPELQTMRFQSREFAEEYWYCARNHWHASHTG